MQTLKITKEHFKKSDSYWLDYIWDTDVSDYDGNIEIDENLWYVRFNSIKAKWYILSKAGSGIEAGDGIKAGWGIEAGSGIKAGDGIKAGWGIKAGLSIKCALGITWKYLLFAGTCTWKKSSEEERTITCWKANGEIWFGILKELGFPEDNKKTDKIA